MNFGEFATVAAGTSGSITMSRDSGQHHRAHRVLAVRDADPGLDRVARGRPDGPIGVHLYWAMCLVLFAGSGLQWLFLR